MDDATWEEIPSVEEARDGVLEAVRPLAPIELPLLETHGCVLATDIVADYDIPAFSTVEVDGFAVRAADIHAATPETPAGLRLAGVVSPGAPPDVTVGWGEAARVPAGSALPAGADAVVPLDRGRAEGESVAVFRPVEEGAFVRPSGLDAKAGEVLVPTGRRLSSPELAVMGAAGRAAPLTFPKVRVAVLSVGPMVEPGRPAAFGQVRDAGSYAVCGALRDAGAVPYRMGIVPDEEAEVREAVLTTLARADCFVAVAGARDEDLDPGRFASLGNLRFRRVGMYPGSQHGFGEVEGTPFFVLPGSPISLFVAFEVLVRPAVLRLMGRRDVNRPEVMAILDEPLTGPSGVTLFAPVQVAHREGAWHATPTGPGDPDLMTPVVRANGLVVVPPGEEEVAAGERVRARIFRPLER